jgi:hypothetical protein
MRVDQQVLLATAMLGLFVAGDVFFRRSMHDHQLAFHLLFRYVAYWWGHLLLVRAETHFARACVCVSLGYFGHLAGVCVWARGKTALQTRDAYWGACATLVVWALACAQLHLLVSYE